MSPNGRYVATSAAERYDQALSYGRDHRLPPAAPRPQPTAAWPAENVALLERYREWLLSGGHSLNVIATLYIPMAGHALGLALKPYPELDLDADLAPALDFVKAKGVSAEWADMCRNALAKFRQFLAHERGYVQVTLRPFNYERYCQGLPDWLVAALTRYQHLRQARWRPARLNEQIMRFWSGHSRFWQWVCQRHPLRELADLKRRDMLEYVEHRLAAGYAPTGVNNDLRGLHGFLLFLQDSDYPVPQARLRMPSVKEPDRLPKYLTDEQVRLLRDDLERRVTAARFLMERRNALLDRAAFYLLWQAGLRLGEVEELRLADLDLSGRQLPVRRGKGLRDRTVFLTATTVCAVDAYLAVRGMGPTTHVFLFRNEPVKKDLIHSRIQAAGERAGVKVHPHRLRHTMATQLLNAGCRITSIQKLLGHQRLNSTMTYARVHDQTAADDYYAAMAHIEARLQLAPPAPEPSQPVGEDERTQLLALVTCLAEPELTAEARSGLVQRMRLVLTGGLPAVVGVAGAANQCGPPGSVFGTTEAASVLVG